MCSPGINGEGELKGQLANTGSPAKMAVKMESVCVSGGICLIIWQSVLFVVHSAVKFLSFCDIWFQFTQL